MRNGARVGMAAAVAGAGYVAMVDEDSGKRLHGGYENNEIGIDGGGDD